MRRLFQYFIFSIMNFFIAACANEKLASVTNIQIKSEHKQIENYIEFTYSGSLHTASEVSKEAGILLLSANTVFCSDKGKKLQGFGVIYYKNIVGYDDIMPIPQKDGNYLYSLFIPVSDNDFRYKNSFPVEFGYPKYNLAESPQDICVQIRGDFENPPYRSNWLIIPEKLITKALSLPPDTERSAAYERELHINRLSKRPKK